MKRPKEKKRIALYGGSFNPPHMGHVIVITSILNSKLVDEVWLIPTGPRSDKEIKISSDDRKSMIAIMLSTMFGSRVPVYMNNSQIDKRYKLSTTYDLINDMNKKYPNYDFYFIIGADLLSNIPKWYNSHKLIKNTSFLLVPRLDEKIPKRLPDYVSLVSTKNIAITNISSSLVRKLIKEKGSLEGIVPPSVINYIIRNKLYS